MIKTHTICLPLLPAYYAPENTITGINIKIKKTLPVYFEDIWQISENVGNLC